MSLHILYYTIYRYSDWWGIFSHLRKKLKSGLIYMLQNKNALKKNHLFLSINKIRLNEQKSKSNQYLVNI